MKVAAAAESEYTEWIGEAKRAETRARRVTQALERLRAGKTVADLGTTRWIPC